jgi:hypothetical protein
MITEMKGHGEKFTRQKQAAIIGLLTQPSLDDAAKFAMSAPRLSGAGSKIPASRPSAGKPNASQWGGLWHRCSKPVLRQ